MKSLMLFLRKVLDESGTWCNVSTSLDYKLVETRIKHEGLSFLTITLPIFGKDFERSLDQCAVSLEAFKGYSRPHGEVLPKFLGGFLRLVFDPVSGRLVDEPSITAIRALRQLTLMWAKINLECSEKRTQAAIQKYVDCEQEIWSNLDSFKADLSQGRFTEMANKLFRESFARVDLTIYQGATLPKHGPGATADKLKGNLKWNQTEWTDRLEEYFPYSRMCSYFWISPEADAIAADFLEPGAERPVKVITVPKTLSTPRIIAVEPTCMQYVQQSILEQFEDECEKATNLRAFIGWSSQIPNQDLARKGSLLGDLATLDLSEASDRVSNLHVEALFAHFPHLREGVQACRSTKADVPGFGVLPLAKFASMGSALTFPIEAMVFLTIIFLAIEDELNRPLSQRDIMSYRDKVRVYGDDIIIPRRFVSPVIRLLEANGLKVNRNKSFWTGLFRESCGKEYFAGHDVTLARVRRMFPTSKGHAEEIVSLVSLRNQLFERGYYDTVGYLDSIIEGLIPFPAGLDTSPGLVRLTNQPLIAERWSLTAQKPLVRAAVISAKIPKSPLGEEGALMKFFLKRGDLPFADRKHLEHAGRPIAITLNNRWVSPV